MVSSVLQFTLEWVYKGGKLEEIQRKASGTVTFDKLSACLTPAKSGGKTFYSEVLPVYMRLWKCMGWWSSCPPSHGKWHCVLRTPFFFSFNGTLRAFVLVLTGAAWANSWLQTANLEVWKIQLSRIIWAVVIICQEITAQLTALLIVSLQKVLVFALLLHWLAKRKRCDCRGDSAAARQ